MHLRQFHLVLTATPFFLILHFSLLVESDALNSLTTFNDIHPVSRPNYGGLLGRGGGCVDDNSGRGCCSNGQDFRGCFSACNGETRCENWCRSNCWNHWSIGSGGPMYGNNGLRGNGRGGYEPAFGEGGGGGGGGFPSPSGRDPEWQYPCSSGPRWAADSTTALLLVNYFLYESSSGYALFERLESEEIGSKLADVCEAATDLTKFGKMVKLKSFAPFKSAAHALENMNDVSEGIMNDHLKAFLEMNLPKPGKKSKVVLGVTE
ncbi:snoRNP complex protein nop56, partial [Linnemannia schmuckeri]